MYTYTFKQCVCVCMCKQYVPRNLEFVKYGSHLVGFVKGFYTRNNQWQFWSIYHTGAKLCPVQLTLKLSDGGHYGRGLG